MELQLLDSINMQVINTGLLFHISTVKLLFFSF